MYLLTAMEHEGWPSWVGWGEGKRYHIPGNWWLGERFHNRPSVYDESSYLPEDNIIAIPAWLRMEFL